MNSEIYHVPSFKLAVSLERVFVDFSKTLTRIFIRNSTIDNYLITKEPKDLATQAVLRIMNELQCNVRVTETDKSTIFSNPRRPEFTFELLSTFDLTDEQKRYSELVDVVLCDSAMDLRRMDTLCAYNGINLLVDSVPHSQKCLSANDVSFYLWEYPHTEGCVEPVPFDEYLIQQQMIHGYSAR